MKKIGFLVPNPNFTGSGIVALDYALGNQSVLGNASVVLTTANPSDVVQSSIIDKWQNEIEIVPISAVDGGNSVQQICKSESIDALHIISPGKDTNELSELRNTNTASLIHVTGIAKSPYGDVYAYVSKWLSDYCSAGQVPYVPHIVELPDSDSDLRAELNIPPDATVFGRIGGGYSWNVHFVNQVISEILSVRSDVYFLLVNTPRISPYMDHERAKFFGPIVHDAALKRQFINTCDAMLHARAEGESFGIACGEFSICNRPVITYSESPERNHIEQLGRKALLYRDAQSLYTLLLGFKANRLLDWNCYKEFGTQRVMEEFKRVFIDAI